MWDDIFDIVAQVFDAAGNAPAGRRSAGPPIDVGTVVVLLGVVATGGGIIMLTASRLPHVASAAVFAFGVVAIVIGIRLAGRR